MRKQSGFTLIELVVVIVILGILAATAIPRFVGFQTDARKASLDGMLGATRAAAALAHAQALVEKKTGATGTISMEGQNVALVYGYPDDAAGGIDKALASFDGYTFAAGDGANGGAKAELKQDAATDPTKCKVTYDAAASGGAPAIAKDTTDCS